MASSTENLRALAGRGVLLARGTVGVRLSDPLGAHPVSGVCAPASPAMMLRGLARAGSGLRLVAVALVAVARVRAADSVHADVLQCLGGPPSQHGGGDNPRDDRGEHRLSRPAEDDGHTRQLRQSSARRHGGTAPNATAAAGER